MLEKRGSSVFGLLFRGVFVSISGGVLTVGFFMLLPVLQAISQTPVADTMLTSMDVADVPPPPPPPEEEEKKEEEKTEEKPPELKEESQPLSLDQLEVALNPGFGDGSGAGDFAVSLKVASAAGGGGDTDSDALFSLADLDQKPRAIHQPAPVMSSEMRKKAPATVQILFSVDQQGRVESPVVQKSSDPAFERAALNAVKQWKFEPGKRNGKSVRFRMRVPITFPRG